jgi:hypothetical protein
MRYSSIGLCPCARVPVCPCARVPVCPCARVPVCPCARVPVCPCARVREYSTYELDFEHFFSICKKQVFLPGSGLLSFFSAIRQNLVICTASTIAGLGHLVIVLASNTTRHRKNPVFLRGFPAAAAAVLCCCCC